MLIDALAEAELEWRSRAACLGMDPKLFYPERGESVKEAKATCEGCPVRPECLAAGQKEKFGIWGGMSERARRQWRVGQPRRP